LHHNTKLHNWYNIIVKIGCTGLAQSLRLYKIVAQGLQALRDCPMHAILFF